MLAFMFFLLLNSIDDSDCPLSGEVSQRRLRRKEENAREEKTEKRVKQEETERRRTEKIHQKN